MKNGAEQSYLDLNAIEARAAEASPGPWWVITKDDDSAIVMSEHLSVTDKTNGEGEVSEEDAEFIAHAREDVPALVAEVKRLRERLEEVAK